MGRFPGESRPENGDSPGTQFGTAENRGDSLEHRANNISIEINTIASDAPEHQLDPRCITSRLRRFGDRVAAHGVSYSLKGYLRHVNAAPGTIGAFRCESRARVACEMDLIQGTERQGMRFRDRNRRGAAAATEG